MATEPDSSINITSPDRIPAILDSSDRKCDVAILFITHVLAYQYGTSEMLRVSCQHDVDSSQG
jgi:ABC-type dipeptide/oligopeptide/nickel transport system ATPase component